MTIYHTENFLSWLRDAHALEKQAEHLFAGQAKRFVDYPELSNLLQQEANNSIENQKLLSIRIQQLGGEISITKDTTSKLIALGQNLTGTFMGDEPVKSILNLYTFAQSGIGSYRILIATAELYPDENTAILCQTILNQYKIKALWLDKNLITVTERFITQAAA